MDFITNSELNDLLSVSNQVKVFNKDPTPSFKELISRYRPVGNIFVKSSDGDYHDLSELIPRFESELEFFKKTGRVRNLYFFVYSNSINPAIHRYSDFVKTYFVPSIYAWYEIKNTITPTELITLDTRNISKHFLSLNNRAAWYRQSLFYYFIKNNLLDKSYFSYRMAGRFDETFDELFERYHDTFKDIEDLDFGLVKSMIPYTTSLENHAIDAYGDWSYGSPEYYNETFCSVICETYTHDYPFFTEKTFKAFKYQHPFFLYSAENSLSLLKDMGFETFSSVFDESYDTVSSPHARFEQMCKEINRIGQMPLEELQDHFDRLRPVLAHNYNHWSNTLPQVYQTEIAKVIKDIKLTIENKSKYLV